MNYSPPSSPYYAHGQAWDVQAEMLASSMMLVSIAEDQAANTGYQTRTPSSGGFSRNSGGSLSRSICQTNLSLLASAGGSNSEDDMMMMDIGSGHSSSSSNGSPSSVGSAEDVCDEWGFFMDSA